MSDLRFLDPKGHVIALCAKGNARNHQSATYAEATWTQKLPDWIGAHVRMFRFFGGVPRLVVPDNLKSGVHKASFYDPEINRCPLRGRRAAGASTQAARQSQGRIRSALCPELRSRPAAPSDLLLNTTIRRGIYHARTCARLRRASCFGTGA